MVGAVPMTTLLDACAHASSIALSAYILRDGRVKSALVAAGNRGAHVSVRLPVAPYSGGGDDLAAANRATVAELRTHGVDARLSDPHSPPLHMKAAVVDRVAFLDDRNWADDGAETIVRTDDADDVAVIGQTLVGRPAHDAHLWTNKTDAERAETQMLYHATADRIDVESESFGFSPVYGALKAKALGGAHVRLIVSDREATNPSNGRERRALQNLEAAGVAIRIAPRDEKMAIVGSQAWVGSANATESKKTQDQIEWGMRSSVAALVASLRANFEANWQAGRPLQNQRL